MWFKKENKNNEQLERIVDILNNCHHLVKVSPNKFINKKINYRFFDMLTGYYWQISLSKNTVTIKTGEVVLTPKDSSELYKMLDIEISKSAIYQMNKQNIIVRN